jgi:hypothetical protein
MFITRGRQHQMNLKRLRLTLVVAVALVTLAASNSFAQNNYAIVPITARDNGTGVAVDTFGVHIDATYCPDGTLSGGFTEEGLPPKPPTGVFDFRFTEHRSGSACMDVGMRVHIQEVAKLDTFKIEFQPSDGGYPFRFSWGSFASWIATDWESLVMVDGFGGILVNVNMKVDTSATVTNSLVNALFIIGKSNAAGGLDVDREGDLVPQRFELQQNYPNPFNPSTTVKFAIEKSAFADVAVYNVIGQKVKTLAAEVLNPGYYTTTWNGTDENGLAVTSGVYFVRMVATGEGAEFSDLRKLLLVK